MTSLTREDFDFVRTLVYQRAAIVLDEDKAYLVRARLRAVAQTHGCGSLAELVHRLRTEPREGVQQKVIEAMTINETSFFRDFFPFEALRTRILPALLAARSADPHVTIWCGASSTGQEPYSLAILLREYFPQLPLGGIRLIATDINTEVLAQARVGIYGEIEVNRGLPAPLRERYFDRIGTRWQVKDEIRRLVEYRACNLMGNWPLGQAVDLVFLRNVLIYFDAETKKAVLARVPRVLRPEGMLFLGAAETALGLDDRYERVAFDRATAYRLVAG